MPPKLFMPQFLEPASIVFYSKDFPVEDIQMERLSWVIWVGSKHISSVFLEERQREILQQTEEEKAVKATEAEIEVIWPQAKECWQLPGLERAGKDTTPESQ